MNDRFVGVQIGPASFVDEGVDAVLDTLRQRVGVNAIMLGTVSWLGLKIGRSISWKIDGWPDHGVPEPADVQGGSYLAHHPEFYRNTGVTNFRAPDEGMRGRDILEMVIPGARARGMKVIPELMEPLFNYAGHGSADTVQIPDRDRLMEVDYLGGRSDVPCLENPDYRNWWHALIEDHCRSYDIDGIMWCNERLSPLDQLVSGLAPGCFCRHCLASLRGAGIDPEEVRQASAALHRYFREARAGARFTDGAFITGLRVLLDNPEFLLFERHWVRRNKDLDRELHGVTKRCDPELQFGLNVWNRNHFNPLRKAQWPWAETKDYADWVKPITYQHQAGGTYTKEMTQLHANLLRDLAPAEMTPLMYRILGLDEAPWDDLIGVGMAPASYVGGQCRATIEALDGELPVLMGIGVDAPRTSPDQAVCTPEIVYESVHAAYDAGAAGVIYAPSYASMKLTNLDGGARALAERGI
ncbi:MAG: hypothetical protein OXE96_15340 [Gemmatimonadetes bacterium]|nr:hypothetical protein [Gemmatimonadota bacterium]